MDSTFNYFLLAGATRTTAASPEILEIDQDEVNMSGFGNRKDFFKLWDTDKPQSCACGLNVNMKIEYLIHQISWDLFI